MNSTPVRVAILLGSPLTQDIFHRIGVPFLSKTFDVTVVDCANWVRVGFSDLKYEKYPYDRLVTVAGESEFKAAMLTLRPAYAIDFIGKGIHTRTIQNILRLGDIRYVAQRITPSPLPGQGLKSRILSLANSNPVFCRAFHRLLRSVGDSNPFPPDVALLAGSRTMDYWTSCSNTILWTGSTDYFALKEVRRARERGNGKGGGNGSRYVHFIDDCLPLSLDYKITGRSRPIEPDEYFRLLLRTFDNIERSLSVPVIVAAHPNGKDISGYSSLFGGRPVHFNATAELSLDCDIAVTHYSTAVAYPVLLRKPIVILNSESLKNTVQGKFMDNLRGLLNCQVLFMESDYARCENIMTKSTLVDERAYDEYEKNYIATGSNFDGHPFQPFVDFAAGRP